MVQSSFVSHARRHFVLTYPVAYAGGVRSPRNVCFIKKNKNKFFPDRLIYKIFVGNQFVDNDFVDKLFGRHHSVNQLFRWQVRFADRYVSLICCFVDRHVLPISYFVDRCFSSISHFVDKDIVSTCTVHKFRRWITESFRVIFPSTSKCTLCLLILSLFQNEACMKTNFYSM